MKNVIMHSARTLSMNITQVVVGLITSVILARALGPEGRGVYALVSLLALTLALFCNPSIYASANYFLSTGAWTNGQAFGTIALSSTITGCVAGLVAVALVIWTPIAPALAGAPGIMTALGVLAAATVISSSFNGLFYGAGKVKAITSWKIALSVLQCLLFLLMWLYGAKVAGYIIAFAALSMAEVVVLAVLFNLGEWRHPTTSRALIQQMLDYSLPVYGSRVLLFAGQRLDTYMLFFFAGTAALGHYTLAVSFAEQIWILPISINLVLMRNLGPQELTEAANTTAAVTRLTTVLVGAGTLALALAMPWLLPLVYGAAYAPAVLPFLLLLPGVAAISIFNILEPFFQSRKRPGIPFVVTLVGLVANFVANLVFIPIYGMVGAALASSIAYVIQLAVMYIAFARIAQMPIQTLFRIDLACIEALHFVRTKTRQLRAA